MSKQLHIQKNTSQTLDKQLQPRQTGIDPTLPIPTRFPNPRSLPIHKFLQKFYTNKEQQNYKQITHVSLNPEFLGSFVINNFNQFDTLYLSALKLQIQKKSPLLYIAEKRHDTSQILIDLDFQKNINNNEDNDFYDNETVSDLDLNQRLYSNLFIKVFINQYIKHLQTYIQIKQQTKIYVLEKTKTYTNNGYVKDGIHIQIPQVIIPLKDQSFIRKKILNDTIVLQQYNYLNLSQPFCKCFDNSATKNVNWLLYGSQKPNNEPYYCNQIYTYHPQSTQKQSDADDEQEQEQQQEQQEEPEEPDEQDEQDEIDSTSEVSKQEQLLQTKDNNIVGSLQEPPLRFSLTDDQFSDSDDDINEQLYQLDNITLDIDGFLEVQNNYSLQYLYSQLSIQQQIQNVEYTQIYNDELAIIQQRELNKQLAQQKINKIFDQSQEENVFIAKQLIELLSNDRADNYDDWMHVGWCCKNISDSLQDSWIEFSSKSNKFNPDECFSKWQDFEKKDMTIASLKYWAKQDNPEQYKQIINKSVNKYINQALGQFNHFNVALVIYHMYKGQFICSNASKKQWWHFQDHRWKNCDNAYLLHNYISTDVKEVFTQKLISLSSQSKDFKAKLRNIKHKEDEQKDLNEHEEQEALYGIQQNSPTTPFIDDNLKSLKNHCENQIKHLDKDMKKIALYVMKLGENSFKNGVVKELAHIFLQDDPLFLDKLDNNPHLLCFNNGVYDLDKTTFRNGVPTDYVTLSTGYDFLSKIDKSDPTLKEIKKYMKQVFVNDDTRAYIWKLFASFLSGTKLDEKFYFMNGCGSNSKSVLLKLLSQSLGDYSTNISVTAVTGKRTQSAQANPEIAASKTARLVIMQEPGNHDQLNIGVVKEFSGNDRIRARMLYDNGTQFTPKFRMVLVCNHLPEVSSQDDGTWRRIQVITFKSRFCANPDKSKNEFKIKSSANIDQKIQKWIPFFMFLLIQCFKTLPKNRPIQESSDIRKDTSEYKRSNNILLCFFQDRYLILDHKRSHPITINDIYQDYTLYCREYNYPKYKTNEVRTFLNRFLQIQDLKNDLFFYIDSK